MSALYRQIMVPLDGSELAAQALPHAEEIARGADATLILLRVVERRMLIGAVPAIDNQGMGGLLGAVGSMAITVDDEAHRQALDQAQETLNALVTSLQHRKVKAEAVVLSGDPAIQIIDYADANAIDLIVMSTHGHTGMARWRFGSVANKVLQAVSCTVVVVRPSLA
jgi:nucleotide-binding universal stress UspA family protein